jgi:hypothetical protein
MPGRFSSAKGPEAIMPTLLDVQQAVCRSLVGRDDRPIAEHVIADGLAPERRLNVYRNTFIGSLTTALRLIYPAVHRLVGADFFEGAAGIFIEDQPPRSAYLDLYGSEFPDFLAGFEPAAALPYLPDVARLEWTVSRALHAPDEPPLDVALLDCIDPADHGRVCFTPHPSVGLVRAAYPADEIWRGTLAQDDTALAAVDLNAGPVWLLVERLETGVEVTRLDEPAWCFSDALFASRPLQASIDAAPMIDAAAALASHLAAGRIVGFELDGHAPSAGSAENSR